MRAPLILAAVVVAALPAALSAQTDETLSLADVMARLGMADVAYNATIEAIPSEETVQAGQQIAMSTEGENGTYAPCFTCHGINGSGDPAGGFPKLASLPAPYLLKRLNEYATAADANEIMSPIAASLSVEQRAAVATWYALQPPTFPASAEEVDADLLQRGARLSAVGSDIELIPACSNCHGPYGSGIPPSVPPLAGQMANYIVAQLQAYAEGTRPADPTNPMPQVAEKMSEEDMRAAGAYFQRLKPPMDLAFPTALEIVQNRPVQNSAAPEQEASSEPDGEGATTAVNP